MIASCVRITINLVDVGKTSPSSVSVYCPLTGQEVSVCRESVALWESQLPCKALSRSFRGPCLSVVAMCLTLSPRSLVVAVALPLPVRSSWTWAPPWGSVRYGSPSPYSSSTSSCDSETRSSPRAGPTIQGSGDSRGPDKALLLAKSYKKCNI